MENVSISGRAVVAFRVEDPTEDKYSGGSVMKFSNVLLNVGGSYDSTTGVFTAPVAGLYQFTAQLCVNKGQNIYYEITKNGNTLHRSRIYESGSAQCCNAEAVEVLWKWDTVSVRATSGQTANIHKAKTVIFNTFTGFLLRETE